MCAQRPCRCSCDLFPVADVVPCELPLGGFCIRWCTDNDKRRWRQFWVRLPNEDDSLHGLPIHLAGEPTGVPPNRASWLWDGNEQTPTLMPSILTRLGNPPVESWHGFITAGRAVSC